jgi:hypothetical protein
MVDPTVKRFGYSVADAANHTCLPTLIPYTVVLVIFKYKSYSFAAPLETGTLMTIPVVLPVAGELATGGATADPVVKVMSLPYTVPLPAATALKWYVVSGVNPVSVAVKTLEDVIVCAAVELP